MTDISVSFIDAQTEVPLDSPKEQQPPPVATTFPKSLSEKEEESIPRSLCVTSSSIAPPKPAERPKPVIASAPAVEDRSQDEVRLLRVAPESV